MKTIRIKFKKIEVAKVDLRCKALDMIFHYEEDGKLMKMQKLFSLDADADSFAAQVVNEAKSRAKEKNADDDDDFIGSFVNVIADDEFDSATTVERIGNAVKRFKDKVRGLKSVGSQEGYMQHYNSLIGLKADI